MRNDNLQQYLDLYRQAKAQLEAAPQPIARLRHDALSALQGATLPQKGDEDYASSDINRMYAPDYGLNINRLQHTLDIAATFRCDIPNISTLLALVVNETFRPTTALLRNLPQGVTVTSLRQAATDSPELIQAHLNTLAANSSTTAALNTLLMQDGILIHLAKDTHLEKPLQIVNIFNHTAPLMAARRILIIAEEGSSAKILLCDHSQNQDVDYLNTQVAEIFLGANSHLDIYDVEESSEHTNRLTQTFIQQQADSTLNTNITTLRCGSTRNEFDINVIGDNATTNITGMAIASDTQTVDNAILLHHKSQHSTSTQLFKYALFDNAQGAFEGKIIVDENARFTDASQTDRNLIATPTAHMHTQPQLEIYCDDVKCSHGASTGQLDQQALFYMQTRGIPRQEAQTLLIQAFMSDIVAQIELPSLRERLGVLVEKRLSGSTASCCTQCGTQCPPIAPNEA